MPVSSRCLLQELYEHVHYTLSVYSSALLWLQQRRSLCDSLLMPFTASFVIIQNANQLPGCAQPTLWAVSITYNLVQFYIEVPATHIEVPATQLCVLSARPTDVNCSAVKPDRMLLCQLMTVQKDKVLWPCLLVTTLMNGVRWAGVISIAMRHSTAIRSVIYIAKDNIKIEFKRSIRCPVALLFPLAVHERHDCCDTFTKYIKPNYLFVFS
jgi:hypothetical protein